MLNKLFDGFEESSRPRGAKIAKCSQDTAARHRGLIGLGILKRDAAGEAELFIGERYRAMKT